MEPEGYGAPIPLYMLVPAPDSFLAPSDGFSAFSIPSKCHMKSGEGGI